MLLAVVLAAAGCTGSGPDDASNATTTEVVTSDASPVAIRRISRNPTAAPMTTRIAPTDAATPASSAVAVGFGQIGAAEIGEIVWTTSVDPTTKAPGPPRSTLPRATRVIYAAMAVQRADAGATIEARWTYNNTPLQGFLISVSFDRDATGLWIEFHIELTGDSTWPDGLYAIEVTVDGQPARQSAVTVE